MFNCVSKRIGLIKTVTYIIALITLLSGSFSVYADFSAETPKNILFISSYSPSVSSVKEQMRGIEDGIEDDLNINIEYEFLNSQIYKSTENSQHFLEMLKLRMASAAAHYDLIIVGNDEALSLIINDKSEIFKNIPIVFLGVENPELYKVAYRDPNITGSVQEYDYDRNITLAKNIFPNADRFIAIIDDSVSGKGQNIQFMQAADRNTTFDFRRINPSELTESEIIGQVSTLSKNCVLIYFSMSESKDKKSYSEREAADIICSNSSVPVMRMIDSGIGSGFLGGCVISPYTEGKYAAKTACSILNGQNIADIPPNDTPATKYKFDFNIISRYDISETAIPAGSTYINYKASFRDRYGKILSLVSIAILLVLMLIQLISKWFESHVQNRKLAHSAENLKAALAVSESMNRAKSEYINYIDNICKDKTYPKNESEPFNLNDILNNVCLTYRKIFSEKNIEFSEKRYDLENNAFMGAYSTVKSVLECMLCNAANSHSNIKSVSLHTTEKHIDDNNSYIEFKTAVNKDASDGSSSDNTSNEAIVKMYADAMNGSVEIETKHEIYITKVTLPLEIIRKTKDDNVFVYKPADSYNFEGCTALIAETNELNLAILSEMLKEVNFNTICVNNGREAVYAFNKAVGSEIDIILVDADMPVMDGYETANTIRKSKHANYATVPIIGILQESSVYSSEKLAKSEFTRSIANPINIDELYYILDKCIPRSQRISSTQDYD